MRFVLAAVLFLLTWGYDAAADPGTPWPTNGRATSSPETQGMDAAPLRALHDRIQAGDFGNVDRLLVIRRGHVVINERLENDYRQISRGAHGALGYGEDSCNDPSEIHGYNYYHPDYHLFYQGRDVHTLQSVTKTVAATMIGAAIHRGLIASVDVSLLSFLGNYGLTRVDDRVDDRLREATLEDLLTMRSGIEWHEQDRPLDSTNTTLLLEFSDDWVQFTRQIDSVNATGWGYGYQWWRLDRPAAIVWAGLGFGGQYLLVLPEHDVIGVLNSWNIFGQRVPSSLLAFLDALAGSVQ